MLTNERLNFLEKLLRCSHPLYFWTYDTLLTLQSSTCENPMVLDALFSTSKCKEYLKTYIQNHTSPVFLNDQMGLMWIAVMEKSKIDKRICQIHMLGPFFVNASALPELKKQIRQKTISVKTQIETERVLERIPTISSSNLFQYALMLEYCVNGEYITVDQIHHQLKENELLTAEVSEESDSVSPDSSLHLGISTIESQLLAMVEDGNLNYSSVLETAALMSSGVQMKSNTSLRRGKNSSIIFIALISRAAIRGGLAPAIAYSLCDFYTDLIENSATISELAHLNHTLYDDFVHRIYTIKHKKKQQQLSPQIITCCDYIQMHICEKISIQSLARLCGYAEYYLTKKFKKETGQSLTDYINLKKTEHAKILLRSSSDSIQEISEHLNFSSRSYFTKVFQEYTGFTPSEYREHGKPEGI